MSNKARSVAVGQVKAAQIRGAPDYPVEQLYPCHMTENRLRWYLNEHLLSVGILAIEPGTISFAPIMVQRMQMQAFRVYVRFDTFAERATVRFTLRYFDKNDQVHEQVGPFVDGNSDPFVFEIPLEHIDRKGTFASMLYVEPSLNEDAGNHHECLIRTTYVEIRA